jgi:transmembrane 9 superfamily member 2/4
VENLGQVVFGDRMRMSPYLLKFNENQACVSVCQKKYKLKDTIKDVEDQEKLRKLKSGISLNYQHHWIMDNLPVTWCYEVQSMTGDGREEYCSTGFPMGCYVTREGSPRYPCPIQPEVSSNDQA